jgi:hypothetical protein
MTVYLAWSGESLAEGLPGPWTEVLVAGQGLAFVDSDDTLSRVYHELKWSLPDGTPLAVTALTTAPKLKGLRAGTTTWLRDRLPPA